jgi:gliding motility-associated-like protein
VRDSNNCTGGDTSIVNKIAASPAGFLPADTAICLNTNFEIKVAGSFLNYLWSTGSTANSIIVSAEGLYTLQVTTADNCLGSDSITITNKTCTKVFFMPSAFSPNGDGHNDLFRPSNALNINTPAKYRLVIYNRLGQKIFESGNPANGWDGTIKGIRQPPGVFVWVLEYQFNNLQLTTEKGTVLLLR